MKRIVIALLALLLTGCASDPLGMAEASRQKWQAETQIAEVNASAAVAIEQARTDLAASNATKDFALATQSQALLREARSDAVIVLLALLLVFVVALLVVYIIYRERKQPGAPHTVVYLPQPPTQRRSLPQPEGFFVDVKLLEDSRSER